MLNIGKKRKSELNKLGLLFFVIYISFFLLVVIKIEIDNKQAKADIVNKPVEIPLTTEEVIRKMATERGWNNKNIDILVKIANCESKFDNYAIGFNDNGTIDRGLFQFNSYWRKDVSNKCAFDIECATNEAINTANKNRNFNAWSCYNKIK